MLDGIDNGRGSDVDSILNDFDTEFVSDKPISKIIDNTYNILVLEVNIHMTSELTEPQQQDCKM